MLFFSTVAVGEIHRGCLLLCANTGTQIKRRFTQIKNLGNQVNLMKIKVQTINKEQGTMGQISIKGYKALNGTDNNNTNN
ncbi:MAG: hypothetical protein LBT04_07555 [Prevotellaceae bacterium]|jgi:hypothetical protein|nr:hypothetical protein [Prevotellaceae bacterium]